MSQYVSVPKIVSWHIQIVVIIYHCLLNSSWVEATSSAMFGQSFWHWILEKDLHPMASVGNDAVQRLLMERCRVQPLKLHVEGPISPEPAKVDPVWPFASAAPAAKRHFESPRCWRRSGQRQTNPEMTKTDPPNPLGNGAPQKRHKDTEGNCR